MPATGKNALTLGRSVVDLSILEEGTPEGLRKVLELFYQTIVGEGWPSPAQDGDDVYQGVYASYDGAEWHIWAGKPDDPTNPDEIPFATGGFTAGCGIDSTALAGGEIAISYGTGLDCVAGVLVATGSPTVALVEGCGIDITGGDTISVAVNESAGLECAGGEVQAKVDADTYVEFDGDGEIAINWDGIFGYSFGDDQLLGHKDSSSELPEWDTVADWLKTLPLYDPTKKQVLYNNQGTIEWNEVVDQQVWQDATVDMTLISNVLKVGVTPIKKTVTVLEIVDVSGETEISDTLTTTECEE